jgi:hypothetical protein
VVTLDSTFIRSCEAGERHLEVRIGKIGTTTGRRRIFGAIARTDTDPAALIRRGLDAVGPRARRGRRSPIDFRSWTGSMSPCGCI